MASLARTSSDQRSPVDLERFWNVRTGRASCSSFSPGMERIAPWLRRWSPRRWSGGLGVPEVDFDRRCRDAAIAEHAHADAEPDDVFRGQLAPTDRKTPAALAPRCPRPPPPCSLRRARRPAAQCRHAPRRDAGRHLVSGAPGAGSRSSLRIRPDVCAPTWPPGTPGRVEARRRMPQLQPWRGGSGRKRRRLSGQLQPMQPSRSAGHAGTQHGRQEKESQTLRRGVTWTSHWGSCSVHSPQHGGKL
jgi:hypothetical protein